MLRWIRRPRRKAVGQQAADAALRRAQSARAETQRRAPEVARTVDSLRAVREENHLAARVRAALGGR